MVIVVVIPAKLDMGILMKQWES